jgi:hypothetical protein
MDSAHRNTITELGRLMARSNWGLHKAYSAGTTKELINRIRSATPLEPSEREFIALVLSGAMGRLQHNRRPSLSRGMRREITDYVRAEVAKGKRKSNKSKLSSIYIAVAKKWNSNPANGRRITAGQVEDIYRHPPLDRRELEKAKAQFIAVSTR